MLGPQRSMNVVERIIARLFVTQPGRWFGLSVLPRLDRPLLYLTRGRVSMSPGQPILLLITLGAKSGRRRATPLLYLPDGDRLVVVASAGGRPRHPAWYYNLQAHPQATVFVRGRAAEYVASEARGEERAALWRKAKDYYLGFAFYEQWVERKIPVIVLTLKGVNDGLASEPDHQQRGYSGLA